MTIDILPATTGHLDQIAALAASRYRRQLADVPALPARYGDAGILRPMLDRLIRAGPGVVAVEDGSVQGFLAAWLLPDFRGRRTAFSPEWAHVASDAHVFEGMMASMGGRWASEGCLSHMLGVLPSDHDGMEGARWLGFGMLAADAVRDLRPVPAPPLAGGIGIRRGDLRDLEHVLDLSEALGRHTASSPVFLPWRGTKGRAYYETCLQAPDRSVWLASREGEALAYLEIGPASEDASGIILDEKTASITAALVRKEARGKGIATALLNAALTWARGKGYARCAVDFEPMNPPARRFWLRHFGLVSVTLIRHVG